MSTALISRPAAGARSTGALELTPVVDVGGTVRGLLAHLPSALNDREHESVRELAACWRAVLGVSMELHVLGGWSRSPAVRAADGPAVICWRVRRGPTRLVRPVVIAGSPRSVAGRARSSQDLSLHLDVEVSEVRRSQAWRATGPAFGGPAPVDEWRWWLVGLACADPTTPSLPSSPGAQTARRRWPLARRGTGPARARR